MGKQGTCVIVDRWTSKQGYGKTGRQVDREAEGMEVSGTEKMTGGQVEKDMGTQTDRLGVAVDMGNQVDKLMGRQGYETGGQVDRDMGNRDTMLWKKR